MKNLKKLSNRFSVTTQITVEDIPAIRAAGFKGIICNRPDGEEAGQPTWHEIKAAALKAGLEPRYVPLAVPQPADEALADFDRAIQEIDGEILAFCRTGRRAEILWNATQAIIRAAE